MKTPSFNQQLNIATATSKLPPQNQPNIGAFKGLAMKNIAAIVLSNNREYFLKIQHKNAGKQPQKATKTIAKCRLNPRINKFQACNKEARFWRKERGVPAAHMEQKRNHVTVEFQHY